MADIIDSVLTLCPDAQLSVEDNDVDKITWFYPEDETDRPTKEEILAEYDKQASVDTSYRLNRLMEYPSIGDQLDALYHAGVFPEDMANKIKEVKDKYPKEV